MACFPGKITCIAHDFHICRIGMKILLYSLFLFLFVENWLALHFLSLRRVAILQKI